MALHSIYIIQVKKKRWCMNASQFKGFPTSPMSKVQNTGFPVDNALLLDIFAITQESLCILGDKLELVEGTQILVAIESIHCFKNCTDADGDDLCEKHCCAINLG